MRFIEETCISWMFFLFFILLIRFFLYIYIIMIKPNKKILTSILLMFVSIVGNAQVSVGGGDGPPHPVPQGGPGPPGLPIDDGLIILFVAALIYGIYIIVKYSKKHTQA